MNRKMQMVTEKAMNLFVLKGFKRKWARILRLYAIRRQDKNEVKIIADD